MATLEIDHQQVDALNDEDFRKHVGQVLTRELSLRGYLRFLRLYAPHTGNYTEERHQWLSDVSAKDLLDPPNV